MSEQLTRLDEVSAIPPIFPGALLNNPSTQDLYTGGKRNEIDQPAESVA